MEPENRPLLTRITSSDFAWSSWRPVEYHRNGVPMYGRSCKLSDSNSWILNRKHSNELARLAISAVEVGRAGTKNKKIAGTWHLLQRAPLPIPELEQYERRIGDSSRSSATTDLPVPDGFSYRAYQRAGIEYGRSKEGNILIGDDMGLGKTIQAIGLLNCQKWSGPVLVVCPASLKINWERELQKWLVHQVTVGRANGSKVPNADVVIINYEILNRNAEQLKTRKWMCVIGDEIHVASNLNLARNQLLHFGLDSGRRIYLTGTPFTTDYYKAWGIFHALDWMSFPNRFDFAQRYCDAKQVTNSYCTSWDFSGTSNETELNRVLRRSFMVRRMKSDVLSELPEKARQIVEVSPSRQLAGLLKQEQAFMPELESLTSRIRELEACGHMAGIGKTIEQLRAQRDALESKVEPLRQEIGLLKVPLVLQHLKDIDITSRKVVLFGVHRKVLEAIADAFGDQAVLFYGGLSEAKRQKAIDRFQTDDSVRLFVGNIKSAGVGLTLTESAHVVFAEVDHDPSKIVQAEDRCCRLGQRFSVLIQFILLQDSYDLDIVSRFTSRQVAADRALNPEYAQLIELDDRDLTPDKIEDLLESEELLNESECRSLLRGEVFRSDEWLCNLATTINSGGSLTRWQRAIVTFIDRKMRFVT